MNKCSKCGAETSGSAKYCTACGTSLTVPFDQKKARVLTRERQWVKSLLIVAAIAALLAGGWALKGLYMTKNTGSHPMFAPLRDASARVSNVVTVKAEAGMVHIPASTVDDGKAHFFAYEAGGKRVTFFVVRAVDGSIRSALDACVACNHAKLGYRQEGNFVVCNNCGMGFKPAEIGVITGGCNPIPIDKSADGEMIVLKAQDLEAGARYF